VAATAHRGQQPLLQSVSCREKWERHPWRDFSYLNDPRPGHPWPDVQREECPLGIPLFRFTRSRASATMFATVGESSPSR